MPDMRDAIAQYLAYTGGQMPQSGGQGMQMPQPGLPPNRQGYPLLPSGQSLPTPISDTGPFPGMPPTPPSPDYTGPQPTNAPPQPLGPGNTDPWQGPIPAPGGAPPPPPNVGPPGAVPGSGQPVVDQFIEPPVNTPMQAPPMPWRTPRGY